MKAMLRFSLYGLITFGVLLTGTRLFTGRLVQHYLEAWLKRQGAEAVSIESVSFNPVTFSIGVRNAGIRQDNEVWMTLEKASINVSPWGLIRGEVQISNAFFQGIRLIVKKEGDQIKVGGFNFFPGETKKATDTLFGLTRRHFKLVRATISDSRVHVRFPNWGRDIRIEKMLVWDGLVSEKIRQGSFTLTGALNGAEMKMESTFGIVADRGSVSSKIDLKKMELEGLQGIALLPVSGIQGELSIDTMIDIEMENDRIEISQKGEGTLLDFHTVIAPYEITNRGIDFQTDFLITLRNGSISSSRLLASLNSRDFQVRDTDTEFMMINWRNAGAEKIEWSYKDGFMLFIPVLRSSTLTVGMPPGSPHEKVPLLAAETITAKDIRLAESDIHIGRIVIDAMETTVVLDPDRIPVNIPEIQVTAKERDEPVTAERRLSGEDGKKKRFGVGLDSLELTGDSRFSFIDRSVDPVFTETFVITKADVTSLDTNNPEQQSRFFLSTNVKDDGKLDINGTMRFPDDSISLTMENRISEYPLAALSVYAGKLWGFDIKDGQLNAETSLEINGNQLFGESMLRINGMQLSPAVSDFSEKQQTAQSILPLDAAWGFLSDKNGNLEIEVPISGNLDDYGFGWGYFFQTLLPKAIRSDAYGVVKKLVAPYGALAHHPADMAVYDGAELIKLRLDPVILKAGEILPGKEADEYTRQLSELLKQESSLRIRICGFATDRDRKALKTGTENDDDVEKILLNLARERANTFQEILVSHYGVPASRIVGCRPNFDSKKGAEPRIEIEM